jgi:hypothetical protein
MSIRLYVGNLPKEPIEREALQEIFAEANAVVSTKVIKDRKTGKCRGFAFVTVSTDEAADEFIEKYNGQSFMDSKQVQQHWHSHHIASAWCRYKQGGCVWSHPSFDSM